MKKYFLILLMFVITINISCNNNGNSTGSNTDSTKVSTQSANLTAYDICEGIDDIDICEEAGGIANVIITEADALKMMDSFITQYRRDDQKKIVHALDSSYWVDKQTWFDIEQFLKTTLNQEGKPKYDGIRIYMACDLNPSGTFPGQQYQHKSGAFIFPTVFNYTPDLKITDHADDRIKIKLSPGKSSPYIQDSSTAGPKIRKFNQIYRRMSMPQSKQKDFFSKSIWIDSCIVFTLVKLLKLPNANLDGVNINLAAYNKFEPQRVPSMLYKNQSTILLVPSSLARGKHINNWAILNCLVEQFKALYVAPPPGGLNHGELCPQVCD